MTHSIKTAESNFALAQKIDHTLLKPTMTPDELKKLCSEAAQFHFKTVCIPPVFVPEAVALLKNAPDVSVITVVGFPLGYSITEAKALEAKRAIADGAQEIDMVINLAFAKAHRWDEVEADVRGVAQACGSVPLKVILETAYLTDDEKIETAKRAERAGAAFIKTSTGFATASGPTGATLADLRLLRETLKPTTKIKASGGIRDFETAMRMLEAGADRLGTSSGVAIVQHRPNSDRPDDGGKGY